MHTIHNVNYSARVYASTNADLGAYAHGNISIYGNFQEIHSKCILLASADVHDKDYHIRIWALYRHVTNILNLGYTMLTIVRGCMRPLMLTSEHTLIEISYPYMVIFRRYTASVSYWLAPMYVEYSGIDFQYSSQHVHNVSHTAQAYNALYTYCGGCAGFTLYSVHSIVYICVVYIINIYKF